MALSIGYTIPGFDIEKGDIGTKECPHLYYISIGQKNDESLVFFVKIHYTFHELHLVKINRTSCNFMCLHKNCQATHKRVRNIANWTVLEYTSAIMHNTNSCKTVFFSHVRRDFRGTHTQRTYYTLQSEVDSTFRTYYLIIKHGAQLVEYFFYIKTKNAIADGD